MATYGYAYRKTDIKCFICFEPLYKASVKGKFNHAYNGNKIGRQCPWYNSSCFELGGWGIPPESTVRRTKTKQYFPKELQEYLDYLEQFKKSDFAKHIKFYI